jgi:hypothetical protein
MFLKTGRGQMFGGRRRLVERWRTSSGDEVHKLEGERIEQSERVAVETERECEPPQIKIFARVSPQQSILARGATRIHNQKREGMWGGDENLSLLELKLEGEGVKFLGETVSRQFQPRASRIGGEGSSSEKFCKGFPSKTVLRARGANDKNESEWWVGDVERGEEPYLSLCLVSE